jgi:hypothetical protein
MARMTVAEAMTNLMWAKMSKVEDAKALGNPKWVCTVTSRFASS